MCTNYIFIIALFILKSKTSALSFNQPKFCPTASWNPHGITFANRPIVGAFPFTVFVSRNNTIYVINQQTSEILVWDENSINPTSIISGNFSSPYSLFVTSDGDIYIDDGESNGRVLKWAAKTNTLTTVMNVDSACFGLFVDTNNTLYCSMSNHHQVVKRSLNDPDTTSTIVAAGTGSPGPALNQLNRPSGIFIDVNFDLYVADCGNDRVQLFQSDEVNGITIAGDTSSNPTINLRCPSGITLDAERNLFIADSGNDRIVGSNSNGFRCLVGCYQTGSISNRLRGPFSLSFDRSGNMFVSDRGYDRIQKFEYLESCFAVSFNRPKFCPTASWNPNGITFANESIVGSLPSSIFINMNNTIYVVNQENSNILVWQQGNINPTNIILGNSTSPNSLFVTSNDDIYIDGGQGNGQVQKWIAKTNTFVTVMNVDSSCRGLFVDTNDTLYCSMFFRHLVVKRSLNNPDIRSIVVAAGIGSRGLALNELDGPWGIFVDVNFDLYVADCGNDRVQLFQSDEVNGITVAGHSSPNPTITLRCPTGITLDAEKNLFIVDNGNSRIVGSSLNGFQCLVGCSGIGGSQPNELFSPLSFSFDRFGNMFVTDGRNSRIQKFQYLEKSCVYSSLILQNVYSSSLSTNNQIYSRDCDKQKFYYESIQVKVIQTGYYSFISHSTIDTYGIIYRNTFDPLNPTENLVRAEDDGGSVSQSRLNIYLSGGMTYVLVMTTYQPKETSLFSISVLGTNKVILERLNTPVNIQLVYPSKLTVDSPTYDRDSDSLKYPYEAYEISIVTKDVYVVWSESNINTIGYIYKNDFNPLKPSANLLLKHDGYCNDGQFKLMVDLEIKTRYVLVVTTDRSNAIGSFSIFMSGPNNVTINHTQVTSTSNIGMKMNFNISPYICFFFVCLNYVKRGF